ncbi:type IV secretory system conjugative DNA transfer family protein [Pseudonocardia sp. WMMC193]|uniref:type IV secretory system conjugative DNA transfer family protein n=1 Tax=Pseudonocardia sp. WMMC193 TaxID=2911965 RepID=UPI001F429CC4|nr:TraM recognition domain-containing protein [Pseudonocardia sp. WMMC193]MCF7552606.1 TraM recognition domain-containing protein [Pseudonocardia sp. WMMC193]
MIELDTELVLAAVVLCAGVALCTARQHGLALVLAAGVGAAVLVDSTVLSWLVGLGTAGLTVGIAWWRWARSAGIVSRWAARNRRKSGVSSGSDILRVAGARAMRRRAGIVRPSLAAAGRRPRTRDVAVQLCRSGFLSVWASVEDVILVFGGPRTGKTGWLAGRVLDAPGAALVTSSRTDLYERCADLRRQLGPVHVFNAVDLGGLPSTIHFNPLTGCRHPVAASERAADMLGATRSAGTSSDREFWDIQARRVLAAFLHAAALGDRSMRDVQGWVADPERAHREVTALLRASDDPAFEQDVSQFVGTNERTRTSITSSVMPALSWLTSPAATAAAADDEPRFDVEVLLRERGTVFVLGAEEAHAAPLVCALTGFLAREARRIAARLPAGRLDPPLTLALDEAAVISPVPLQSWTADMGGRGVTIIGAFQSRAQLLARWGEHDAATILNNTGAAMIFGGTLDRDDLEFWSTVTGDRDEPVVTTDSGGAVTSRTVRKVPVLAPGQIGALPTFRVLLIRKGIPPVIGRAPMVWHRIDIRTAAWRERRRGLAQRAARIWEPISAHPDPEPPRHADPSAEERT